MVQIHVSQLRRVLAPSDAAIETHGRGYALRVADDAVDATRFRHLVERAARVPAEDGAARRALDLWHGAALADVAGEPFAAPEIRRLEELRLRAWELAVEADIAAGREDQALAELERLIDGDPLRERLYALRMLALYRSGRQAEALETYITARRRLIDEVGVEPGAELHEVHERILRHDPALRGRTTAGDASAPAADTVPSRDEPRVPPEPAGRGRRRPVLIVAAVVAVASVAAFLALRLTGTDRSADIAAGAVGVVDAGTRTVTRQLRVTPDPGAVVAGAGSVWIASPSGGTVARIRPGGRRVDTIDVAGRPAALAFGGGSLWAADADSGDVAQIDPRPNRVVQRVRLGNGLRALAVAHGALWGAAGLDGEVVRFDLRTGRSLRRTPVGGEPTALAAAPDAVWVTAENGRLLRLDRATGLVTGAVRVGSGPGAVQASGGAVWVANTQDGTVSRVEAATQRVTWTVPADGRPSSLTLAGGGLWVGDETGALLRLDPRTGRRTDRIGVRSPPTAVAAVGGDEVWAIAAPPATVHRGGTLRIVQNAQEFDPALADIDYATAGLLFDGLVRFRRAPGAAGATLVPALAVAVPEPDEGGRRYAFALRAGLRYADGSEVRAGDVRASLERALRGPAHEDIGMYDAIAGAAACRRLPARCDLSAGVVADDDARTVTLRLTRPDPELLANLTLPVASVLPASAGSPRSGGAIVGTGPYRVARTGPQRAVLLRNPHFRGSLTDERGSGFASRVEIRMGMPDDDAIAEVERDRADLASAFALPPEELAAIRTRFGSRLVSSPFYSTLYAWIDTRSPPFDDVRARRALNLAVDRRRAVEVFGGAAAGVPTCQLLPAGFPGQRPMCPFTARASPAGAWSAPDPLRARALAQAAGLRGSRVELLVPTTIDRLAHVISDALGDLGVTTRVRRFDDYEVLLRRTREPQARGRLGLLGWIADHPHPAGFLRPLVACDASPATGGMNVSRFCEPSVDAAIRRAERQGTGGDAWLDVERRIAAAAPVVPLLNARLPVVTARRVGNVQFNLLTGPLLDKMWVR